MAARHPRLLTTLAAVAALLLAGTVPGAAAREGTTTLEGTAVRVVVDDPEGGQTRTEVLVVHEGGAVELPGTLADDLLGGEQVQVRVDGARSLEEALPGQVRSVTVTRAVQPASQLGRHDVVLAPVYLSGSAPPSPTVADLRQMVAGMDDYLDTTTDGQVRVVEFEVQPWARLTLPSPTCQGMYEAVFQSTLPTRTAGTMPPGPASHVVYYTPQMGCGFAGIASMGVGASGYPVAWLHGDSSVSTATHELGHNMTLGHSGRIECYSGSGAVVVGLSSSCTELTYEDAYDVMSAPLTDLTTGVPGEMAAYHQRRLGALAAAHVPVVGAGTHTLNRLSATSGVRGLQIPISSTRTLHLEYRTPTRLDSWIESFQDAAGGTGPGSGVLVRVIDPRDPTADLSVVDLQARDATYHVPAPGGGYYVVDADTPSTLPVGTTWDVQGASPATSITVTATTASAATVVVTGSTRPTSVVRWQGSDRWGTAARIATAAYPDGARTVFLANGREFPDALAGSPVAGVQGAPMLLTPADRLASATRTALSTLGADRVVILGGAGAVSTAVETELAGMGLAVERWSGANRYLTAVAISQQAYPAGAGCLYVASGASFPDALSGAPAAGAGSCSLLLVPGTGVPSGVLSEVGRLDPSHVTFVGGTGAVSAEAAASIVAAADGATSSRMQGSDRWATSAAVSRLGPFVTPRAQVFVASGQDFPDALSLAAVAAHRRAPLLLTSPTRLPSAVDTEIRRLPTPMAVLAGGTGAVSAAVEQLIHAALR